MLVTSHKTKSHKEIMITLMQVKLT